MVAEVLATPRAEQQIDGLSRRNARVFDELAGGGCRALAYRLSGQEPVDHLCVRHLSGSLRVVVAFETPRRAWILLAGPHDDQDPVLNVYAELYRLLGVEPPSDAGRSKPSCCGEPEGLPPILGDALAEILDRTTKLRRTRQSRWAAARERGQDPVSLRRCNSQATSVSRIAGCQARSRWRSA